MSDLSIGVEELESITADVWSTFVGEDAVVLPFPSERPNHDADITAHVRIRGSVAAAVVVACDSASAGDLARRMFDLGPDGEAGAEDIADALGELSNIVGGNVKSLAPDAASLTLPEVGAGELPGDSLGVPLCWVDVVWDGGQAGLSIWTGDVNSADASSTVGETVIGGTAS